MPTQSFKDLFIWKEAYNITLTIYEITKDFPKFELFSLTNQLRRSSHSVNTNIVEGFHRNTGKEFVNFLHIAKGSVNETMNHLILAKDLGYITNEQFLFLEQKLISLSKIIYTSIKKQK